MSSSRRLRLAATILLTAHAAAQAQAPAASCGSLPAFARLDFWVGEWDVFVGTQKVGENSIVKVEGGCAITEAWTAEGGGTGRSLFYVGPEDLRWRQVWVTAGALAPGGVKEKREVDFKGAGIRFQGTVADTARRTWLDRTTLSPNADGSVRQHIEISTDNGTTWRTTFDAVYRKRR